jgi:DNA-binding Lrp family transcriptional regulator
MTPDEVSKWANEQLREVACNVDGTDTPFVVQAELKGWNKGYVLAPPSLNAPSGRRYWWLTEPPKSRDDLPLWMPLIAPKARENTKSKSSSKRRKSIKVDEGVIDAFVALLAPHWIKGKRHHLALYLTGFLGKAGWSWNDTERFLCKIAQIADDEELDDDRLRALRDTYAKLSHNPNGVAGLSQLAKEKLLPDWVLTALQGLVTLTNRTDKEEQKTQRDCPFCQLSDAELFERARPVLDAENPVADAAKRLCDAANIVAEDENAQLLLLIATTRILPKPVHALVVGTTGAGKSALVNAVSAAIPPCHRRTLVGTSARALLFHPLKPTTLLNWLELPNLDSESIASTILRTLLWQDGSDSADYLLTEWIGGRAKARTLKLPRQIALLSTRTDQPKDEQLATRLFIVEVKETREKRPSVLSAIARQWQDGERPDPDALRHPVVAFMEWAQRRSWHVAIPFADALMALLSQLPPAARDYRDADNLLRLIAASAIWHLQHRQHAIGDESVTVIADLADYALVRQLVAPSFAKTRAFAISEGERQVVDALRLSDAPMTVKELAERIGLNDAAVRMRLQALKKKGVVSDESVDSKRKAWRLEATPTAPTDLLPTVEALKARWQPEPPDPTPEADAKMRRDAKEAPPSHFSPIKQGTFGDAKMRRSDLNRGQNPPYLKADDFNQPDSQCFTREKHCPSANVIETAFAPSDAQKRKENKAENAKGSSPSHSFASSDVPSEGDLEVKVVCPRCGAWKRIPPDILMLTDPRCLVCGEVMRPASEDDPPEGDVHPQGEFRG